MKKPYWRGVFPAITTQMKKDGALDLDATARHATALIQSGVAGVIFLGSLGENQSLSADEKRRVIEAMVETVNGRIDTANARFDQFMFEWKAESKDFHGRLCAIEERGRK